MLNNPFKPGSSVSLPETVGGLIVTILGVAVLAGWQWDIDFLKSCIPGTVSMKANTAAAFLLSGLASLLIQRSGTINKMIVRFLSGIILFTGLLTLFQYIFGWNFGIDEILFRDAISAVGTSHQGRMSPLTAINFIMLATVFLSLSFQNFRQNLLLLFLLIFAFSISILGFIGYVFGITELTGLSSFTKMALNTSIAFIILISGIIYTVYNNNITKITLEFKLLTSVTIVSVIIIFESVSSLYSINSLIKATDSVERTLEVKNELMRVVSEVYEFIANDRAYLISGNENILENWRQAKNDILKTVNNLRELTRDNPKQQEVIILLDQLIKGRIEFSDLLVETYKTAGENAEHELFSTLQGTRINNKIDAIVLQMSDEENRLLRERNLNEKDNADNIQLIIVLSLFTLLILLMLIYFFVKTYISERRKAERILRQSEERFKNVFENSPVGKSLTTVDGKLSVNNAFCEIVGYTAEELSSLHWKKISHPGDIEETEKLVVSMLAGEINKARFQKRYIHKSGKTVWADVSTFLQRDADGNPQFFITSVSDVTKLKQAEYALQQLNEELEQRVNKRTAELRLSEQKYRDLVDNAIVGAYSTTLTGEFLFVNDAFAHILEAGSPERLISTYVIPYYKKPRDRKWIIELLQKTGKVQAIKMEMVTKKSNPVTVMLSARLENNIISGMMIDITERTLAEEKYRELVNTSIDGVISIDSQMKIVLWNRGAEKIFGYKSREILGQSLMKIVPVRYREAKERGFVEFKKSGFGPVLSKVIEIEGLRKDKTEISIELSVSSRKVGNARIVTAIVRDITNRKAAEEEIHKLNTSLEIKVKERTKQFEQAKQEAEQANLAKSEFLSRMSHELRTPMNSILGFAQLMNMGQLAPAHKKGVNHILKAGKHLLGLINEVLDISRIEAGRRAPSLEPVLLQRTIDEVLDIVNPLAAERIIKVDLVPPPDNLFIKADQQWLRQVLLNLVNNAIKYNSEGGSVRLKVSSGQSTVGSSQFTVHSRQSTVHSPQFTVHSSQSTVHSSQSAVGSGTEDREPETEDRRPQAVRISVSDTGKGITPENIKKLFTPFERIGAQTSEIEGTGLGLSVVKNLVELMNGNVGVESEPGVGSIFWIELPQAEGQVEYNKQNGGLANFGTKQEQKKGTLLYIEDNTSNIDLVEQILKTYHPEISLLTEKYGREAVKDASDYKPNLILLDLNLPDIHGSEVLKLLQSNQKTKTIPVVVISADAMEKQVEKLLKSGAKDYLTKPLDVVQFLKVIDKYMGL